MKDVIEISSTREKTNEVSIDSPCFVFSSLVPLSTSMKTSPFFFINRPPFLVTFLMTLCATRFFRTQS